MRTRLIIFILSCGIQAVHGLRRLVLGSAVLILALNKPSSFDRKFYRGTNKESRLAQLCPLLEFSFRGVWKWKDPSESFSTSAYVAAFPGHTYYPPYLHAQMANPTWRTPDLIEDRAPIPDQNDEQHIYSSKRQIFEDIWKNSLTDLQQFMNSAHQLTPNVHLHYKMYQSIKVPFVNRNRTLSNLLDLIPLNTKHILAVPLLGTAGGSEKISADLIKVLTGLYAQGDVAVVGPDNLFAKECRVCRR